MYAVPLQQFADPLRLPIMFRIVCSILLIANLLTCPARCISCHVATANVKDRVPAGCACCYCEVEPPVLEPVDDYPSNDCACPNCICEGATLEDCLELPDANTQAASFCCWTARIERTISVAIWMESKRRSQDSDCRFAGRDARVAHHSWLI